VNEQALAQWGAIAPREEKKNNKYNIAPYFCSSWNLKAVVFEKLKTHSFGYVDPHVDC